MRFEDIDTDRFHAIELDKFRERKFQPVGIERVEQMINEEYFAQKFEGIENPFLSCRIKRLEKIKDYLERRKER